MATKLYFLFLEAFSDVTVSFTKRRKTMKLRQETQKSKIYMRRNDHYYVRLFVRRFQESAFDFMLVVKIEFWKNCLFK